MDIFLQNNIDNSEFDKSDFQIKILCGLNTVCNKMPGEQ